jgi:hypothetical protein
VEISVNNAFVGDCGVGSLICDMQFIRIDILVGTLFWTAVDLVDRGAYRQLRRTEYCLGN